MTDFWHGRKRTKSPFGGVTKSIIFWWTGSGGDLPVASGARLLPLERLTQPARPDEGGAEPVLQAAKRDLLEEEVALRLGKVARGDRLRLAQNLVARGADQPVQFASFHFAPQLNTQKISE